MRDAHLGRVCGAGIDVAKYMGPKWEGLWI